MPSPKTPKPAPEPKKIIPLTIDLDQNSIERAILKYVKSITEDTWEMEKLISNDKGINDLIKDMIKKAMSSDKIQAKITAEIESEVDGIIKEIVSLQVERMAKQIVVPKEKIARVVIEALTPQPPKPKAQPKKAEEAPQNPEDEA